MKTVVRIAYSHRTVLRETVRSGLRTLQQLTGSLAEIPAEYIPTFHYGESVLSYYLLEAESSGLRSVLSATTNPVSTGEVGSEGRFTQTANRLLKGNSPGEWSNTRAATPERKLVPLEWSTPVTYCEGPLTNVTDRAHEPFGYIPL